MFIYNFVSPHMSLFLPRICIFLCLLTLNTCTYFYFLSIGINIIMNYHDQKICRTPTYDIQEHWTAVSTLLGLISSVYCNLHHWRSNQRPQKCTDCSAKTLQLSHQFISYANDAKSRLFGRAITMTSSFGVTYVRYELVSL